MKTGASALDDSSSTGSSTSNDGVGVVLRGGHDGGLSDDGTTDGGTGNDASGVASAKRGEDGVGEMEVDSTPGDEERGVAVSEQRIEGEGNCVSVGAKQVSEKAGLEGPIFDGKQLEGSRSGTPNDAEERGDFTRCGIAASVTKAGHISESISPFAAASDFEDVLKVTSVDNQGLSTEHDIRKSDSSKEGGKDMAEASGEAMPFAVGHVGPKNKEVSERSENISGQEEAFMEDNDHVNEPQKKKQKGSESFAHLGKSDEMVIEFDAMLDGKGLSSPYAAKRTDSLADEDGEWSDASYKHESSSEEDEEGFMNVAKPRSQSRPFDLKLVIKCMEEGMPALDDIRDKHVVLVLGKTGTGKSTFINGLAGKTFVKAVHESTKFGRTVRKDVFEAENPLNGFEIGHAKESKTKFIKCHLAKSSGGSSDVAYVDSPGFEDTDGPEVDIATCAMVHQLVQRCKTLRFVLLINYASLLEDRGGATRTILKLTRNFVDDFEKNKLSFSFFFTHTNEIKSIPDSIQGARDSLLKEIVRTAEGTKDTDLLAVLDYMQKSLKKRLQNSDKLRYQLVDIIRPMETDFSQLKAAIETGSRPLKEPFVAGNCGLTPTLQRTLGAALQTLLARLNAIVNGDAHELSQMNEVVGILRVLEKYIDIEVVRKVGSESNVVLREYLAAQTSTVEEQLQRGTDARSGFSEANLEELKTALSRIQALENHSFSEGRASSLMEDIKRNVFGFHKQLMLKPEENFDALLPSLEKLRVWSEGFTEFSLIGSELQQWVRNSSEIVEGFDVMAMASLKPEDLSAKIQAFCVLHMIRAKSAELKLHGVDMLRASHAVASLEARMSKALRDWPTLASASQPPSLEDFASWAGAFEIIQKGFDGLNCSSILVEQSAISMRTLVQHVQERFAKIFSNIQGAKLKFHPGWKEPLQKVKDKVSLFEALEGEHWRGIAHQFAGVVRDVGDSIKTRMTIQEQKAREILQRGFMDGEKENKAIDIVRCSWFDDFLPLEHRFVENAGTMISQICKNRIEYVHGEIDGLISAVSDEPSKSVKALRRLRDSLLPELEQISLYDPFQTDREAIIRSRVRKKISSVILATKASLETWNGAYFGWKDALSKPKCHGLDTSLERTLREARDDLLLRYRVLLGAKGIDATMDTSIDAVEKEILDVFVDFSRCIELVINCKARYRAKASCLSVIEKSPNSPTSSLIPDFHAVTETVREKFEEHAKVVEDLVSKTSEWEKIETQIKMVKNAMVLDQFLSNEVTTRLRLLFELVNQTEGQVEGLVQNMMVSKNFAGVRDLLAPLKKSSFDSEKEKFALCLNAITSSLSELVQLTHELLRDPYEKNALQRVGDNMTTVKEAQKNLGQFLHSTELSLAHEIKLLIEKVNSTFCKAVDNITESAANRDFLQLGLARFLSSGLSSSSSSTRIFLNQREMAQRLPKARTEYKRAVDSLPSLVSESFDSLFRGDELLDALTSLHSASACDTPRMDDFTPLYASTKKAIVDRLNKTFQTISRDVRERECFDEAIEWLGGVDRCLSRGLKDHIPEESLEFDSSTELKLLRANKLERDRSLDFDKASAEMKLREWAKRLDRLNPRRWSFFIRLHSSTTYESLRRKLEEKVCHCFRHGELALKAKDLLLCQECIELLEMAACIVGDHIDVALKRRDTLKAKALDSFVALCKEAQEHLEQNDFKAFQRLFSDYRSFVLCIPFVCTAEYGLKNFSLTNQTVCAKFEQQVTSLQELIDTETRDFAKVRRNVEDVRAAGNFLADAFTLFEAELSISPHAKADRWLAQISKLCGVHFSSGRRLSHIKYFAVLGIPPSSSMSDMLRSRDTIMKLPSEDQDAAIALKNAKEACTELENVLSSPTTTTQKEPFHDLLSSVGDRLRRSVRIYLAEQKYDLVEEMLFNLKQLHLLDDLVSPSLNSKESCEEIESLVKSHVQKTRIEVDSRWSEKNYKALNETIADLKAMEGSFKAYPTIFPESWNKGITERIKTTIESLGTKAKDYVQNRTMAKQNFDDFRRCFVEMGFVFVEVASFKAFTMQVMSSVLESCLDSDWGYNFVFDLGLALQKGDEYLSEDENRVAQVIVAEFSQFKEVQTMVWNEETTQKPVEDTVHDIRGELHSKSTVCEMQIDETSLLQRFWQFEDKYKAFLLEYLCPDSDLNNLVHRIKERAAKLKPSVSCSAGWGAEVKSEIPIIAAGVFAAFTVLKSGESFNRIEDTELGEKVLMKPHNIQVLTLLSLLGCGDPANGSLESQVMQIRTGEGKSIILGATAVVLGLLGFRIRCICYSEYLSNRDFNLFRDLFDHFQLASSIKYSKITTLSEETTAAKGDLRKMTELFLEGNVSGGAVRNLQGLDGEAEEILVVDEFDVFFGPDFYGKTYNLAAELRDPEIAEILKSIWTIHKRGGRKQSLGELQESDSYKTLLRKYGEFDFLLENEIQCMLDQVDEVDNEPYHLDRSTDRIGYRVMDTVEYGVTYGYRTAFAYLQEADKGNLKNPAATLANALTMPVSCGQFSYANISPDRIIGVSGTVEAMGNYERSVLAKYGIERFVYVPSVYGESNFSFDAAGEGIYLESKQSDFYHRITSEITDVVNARRSVIVFFKDASNLRDYTKSAFYTKLGRNKRLLTEDMAVEDKDFVIKKASTTGQITLCTAVFGRGTDFFCKDEGVQKNGGVHIIQAFLSAELSEEIQIKGRTARQGKKGSYQMIILESDLKDDFGIEVGEKDKIAKEDRYEWLTTARNNKHSVHCRSMDEDLQEATEKDERTHRYFDALLAGNRQTAMEQFKEIYTSMKTSSLARKADIDLALLVDTTGSMTPYSATIAATVQTLVAENGAVMGKLKQNFPETEFTFRVAVMGFRDIDDKQLQFKEMVDRQSGSHFTEKTEDAIKFITAITKHTSGGGDLAEDVLGAISRSSRWDWTSRMRFMMVLTDAPAHGLVVASQTSSVSDNFSVSHPSGLKPEKVMGELCSKGIDLFLCSFNPTATSRMEQELSTQFSGHSDNLDNRQVAVIPLVPKNQAASTNPVQYNRHIIFVLDESGSMSNDWSGVVKAYNDYLKQRRQFQCDSDFVSVVQFSGGAQTTVPKAPIMSAPSVLHYHGGGTAFSPAARHACAVARAVPQPHVPVVVFMSDGQASDASTAANEFAKLNAEIKARTGDDLELHVIAFRSGADQSQLSQIANASPKGKLRSSSDGSDLSTVFVEIAGGSAVVDVLEAEIGKRVSEAVSDKLTLEFKRRE